MVTLALSRTASLKVADAPLRLMLAPMTVRPAASVVRTEIRSLPPMTPLKVVAPEALTVSAFTSLFSESMVEARVTFVPVRVVFWPRMTAPL